MKKDVNRKSGPQPELQSESREVRESQHAVSFETTLKDGRLINEIVVRAASLLNLESFSCSRLDLSMDITAVHANGCKLKLAELLAADEFNFNHDVCGIMRHIDRRTGQLQNCFVPRFAVPSSQIKRSPEGA